MSSLSRLRQSMTTNQYIIGGIALFGAVFLYDYSSWRNYGGTPSTLLGYLKVQRWSLALLSRRHSLTDPSPLAETGPSHIKSRKITHRKGGRPTITRWILPQRQQPEKISQNAEAILHGLMAEFADTPPYAGYIETRPSKAEGGVGPAIYVKPDIRTINPAAVSVFYEIAHVHPQDNSLHVYLSPQDAKLVMTMEWGQRFPVEGMAPPSWIMVYAPRNEEEVEVVREIVRAAVCFAVGRNVQALSGSFQ